ncbi:hypothetical protein GCM10010170_088490 [Dactylosporangium salmoneum]|uniref:Uncharacterized protein n=1 Tax=Dactylosporangium salmoneum TaxID=53361 RepID=A0ABN3HJ84_9ACTN
MATAAPLRRRRTGATRAAARGVAFALVRVPVVALAGVAVAARVRGVARFCAVARVFEPPRALDVPPPRPAWEVRPAMVTP